MEYFCNIFEKTILNAKERLLVDEEGAMEDKGLNNVLENEGL